MGDSGSKLILNHPSLIDKQEKLTKKVSCRARGRKERIK
jgi:hypothetical protein